MDVWRENFPAQGIQPGEEKQSWPILTVAKAASTCVKAQM
jgi:hypothetical protein